jgi:hypothetical protein
VRTPKRAACWLCSLLTAVPAAPLEFKPALNAFLSVGARAAGASLAPSRPPIFGGEGSKGHKAVTNHYSINIIITRKLAFSTQQARVQVLLMWIVPVCSVLCVGGRRRWEGRGGGGRWLRPFDEVGAWRVGVYVYM